MSNVCLLVLKEINKVRSQTRNKYNDIQNGLDRVINDLDHTFDERRKIQRFF